MRATGTATIAFGMVSIPIKLYSTSGSEATLSFRQIDKVTGAPVKQKLVSSKDGRDVPREDIIKGYEIAKDQYVFLTEEEFDSASVEATKSVDITEFVPVDSIDPRMYTDKHYFLAPDKGGAKAYWLLHRALLKEGVMAVAQYATRDKQYLVAIRAVEGEAEGMLLHQLKYPEAVRSWAEFKELGTVDPVILADAEVGLAVQLIKMSQTPRLTSQTQSGEPKYFDQVQRTLISFIEQKAAGASIQIETVKEPAPAPMDLMAALQASLSAKK